MGLLDWLEDLFSTNVSHRHIEDGVLGEGAASRDTLEWCSAMAGVLIARAANFQARGSAKTKGLVSRGPMIVQSSLDYTFPEVREDTPPDLRSLAGVRVRIVYRAEVKVLSVPPKKGGKGIPL